MTITIPQPERRFSKRRLFAIAGLLFAGFLVYRVFFVYTVRSGNCEPATAAATRHLPAADFSRELVVMSWNIEGHAALLDADHLRKLARIIREENPDVLALQEVHRGTVQSRFRDQAAELARLTGMHVTFGRSFEVGDGEYGNAVLTRMPAVEAVVHPLPSVGEPRTLLEVRTEVAGAPIVVFVTHLVTWGRLTRAVRGEQLECIRSRVAASPFAWVLLGDLNAPPDAGEIRDFRASAGIGASGPDAPTHKLTEQQLDYLVAHPGWELRAARVVPEGPSDHRAIVARLGWRAGAGEAS